MHKTKAKTIKGHNAVHNQFSVFYIEFKKHLSCLKIMAKFNIAVILLGFLLISFMLIEAGD